MMKKTAEEPGFKAYVTKRGLLRTLSAGVAAASAPAWAAAVVKKSSGSHSDKMRCELEGERCADQGDGTYLNPVLAGDHPDPSILKDGNRYYKVSSSFDYYPGLVVWQSDDLVNWKVVAPTLHKPVGCVFAPDLVKHQGRYFIYFPTLNFDYDGGPQPYGTSVPILSNWVIYADKIEGPWSDPINLPTGGSLIDPGHVVGEDGKRYLFLSKGYRVPLTPDGLRLEGKPEKVYEGWPIPDDWVVEGFGLEGPKLLRRNGWFYMFSAQGGTGGPPTSHMIVVARSRSINGPWENCPHNPIVHTKSMDEPWWSRGHGTPVEGPKGDWWLVYHGYENDYRTLGRQMLLEPMKWMADDWPVALGGDLSHPLKKPISHRAPVANGPAKPTSDPFGSRLAVYRPKSDYLSSVLIDGSVIKMTTTGTTVKEATPLVLNVGEHSYTVTVEMELDQGAVGGLMLFYNKRAFCGLSISEKIVQIFKDGRPSRAGGGASPGRKSYLRVINDRNVASFYLSADGSTWRRVVSYDVAGYNQNIFDHFLSLRPAVFAAGSQGVHYRDLTYVGNC